MPNPFAGLFKLLAFYRLYRWWNTSPGNNHTGRRRAGRV